MIDPLLDEAWRELQTELSKEDLRPDTLRAVQRLQNVILSMNAEFLPSEDEDDEPRT